MPRPPSCHRGAQGCSVARTPCQLLWGFGPNLSKLQLVAKLRNWRVHTKSALPAPLRKVTGLSANGCWCQFNTNRNPQFGVRGRKTLSANSSIVKQHGQNTGRPRRGPRSSGGPTCPTRPTRPAPSSLLCPVGGSAPPQETHLAREDRRLVQTLPTPPRGHVWTEVLSPGP